MWHRTLGLLVVLLIASDATGQLIVPTAQDRSVLATAFGVSLSGPDQQGVPVGDSARAPDFSTFSETVAASAGDIGFGSGDASQTSSISGNVILAEGSVSTSASDPGDNQGQFGDASSSAAFQFQLSETVSYTLMVDVAGEFDIPMGGISSAEGSFLLTGPSGVIYSGSVPDFGEPLFGTGFR